MDACSRLAAPIVSLPRSLASPLLQTAQVQDDNELDAAINSIMASARSPAQPSAVGPTTPSFLAISPSSVVLLLTQFLSLRDKLCQWRRLSRAADAALQPPSFAHDSLAFGVKVSEAWKASPALKQLLSLMGSVLIAYPKPFSPALPAAFRGAATCWWTCWRTTPRTAWR